MSVKTLRCGACSVEFADAEIPEGTQACPSCGWPDKPLAVEKDVTLTINWDELRMLCLWADGFAYLHGSRSTRDTLAHLLKRLSAAEPPNGGPLRLADELLNFVEDQDEQEMVLT